VYPELQYFVFDLLERSLDVPHFRDTFLFRLGMEASRRVTMKTIDSVLVALVHGVRVDSHMSVSYGLQPDSPGPCRMQVQYYLV
jgi:hypothetical protein